MKISALRGYKDVPAGVLRQLVLVSALAAMTSTAWAAAGAAPTKLQLAEAARDRGECLQASQLYADAAESLRDVAVARRAADLAQACDIADAQWRAVQRWRTLDPENVESLLAFGLVALSQHRIAAARDVFTALFARTDVDADRALADLLPAIAERDAEQPAWAVLRTVIDRKRISPATRVAIARLAGAAYDFAGARAELEPALAASPDSADGQRLAAKLAAADGNGDAALKAAARADELSPTAQRFARAETLSDLDRIEVAQRELERLVQIEETHDEAQRRLALLALSQADYNDARRRFVELLGRGGPASVEAFYYLGVIAELTNDKPGALAAYQRLADAGGGLLPRVRAAALLLENGDQAAAMKLFDDLAQTSPQDDIQIALSRASVLSDAKLHDDAIVALNAALLRHPGDSRLRYEQAMHLERAGRTADALREFEALLVLRPDDPNILNSLGYTLVDHKRDLPRAERMIRRAVALMPDNAALIDSLGWALFRRGASAEALPLLERAWTLSYDDEIAAHWGEVLWASGDKTKARSVWARALIRESNATAVRATMQRLGAAPPAPATPPASATPAARLPVPPPAATVQPPVDR